MIPVIAVRTDRRVPSKEVYRTLDGLKTQSHLGKERNARYKAMTWTAYQIGGRPKLLAKAEVRKLREELEQQRVKQREFEQLLRQADEEKRKIVIRE